MIKLKLLGSALGVAAGITGTMFGIYLLDRYHDGTATVEPGDDPIQVLWRIVVIVLSFMATWLFVIMFAKCATDEIFG